MTDNIDLIEKVGRNISRKILRGVRDELKTKAIGYDLQLLLFFSALHRLIIEVFALAPTVEPKTDDERRKSFYEFVKVITEDFESTLNEKLKEDKE